MHLLKHHGKRILTDSAGYLLILAGIATGWLPGPGGIPLIVAGLGLLSINNLWAKELRIWVIKHGGKLVAVLFPRWTWLEWLYDIIALSLLGVTFVLEVRHGSLWEMGLGISAFFIALFIALTNRDRLNRLRGKHKR